MDATSRITANAAGFRGTKVLPRNTPGGNGEGPGGGIGGSSVRDSGGGGHGGAGGNGTADGGCNTVDGRSGPAYGNLDGPTTVDRGSAGGAAGPPTVMPAAAPATAVAPSS